MSVRQFVRSVCLRYSCNLAPLAQLDRASGYEPEGREFESLRAHHPLKHLSFGGAIGATGNFGHDGHVETKPRLLCRRLPEFDIRLMAFKSVLVPNAIQEVCRRNHNSSSVRRSFRMCVSEISRSEEHT